MLYNADEGKPKWRMPRNNIIVITDYKSERYHCLRENFDLLIQRIAWTESNKSFHILWDELYQRPDL